MTPRRRPVFHPLRVGAVDQVTEDSVAVRLDVPPDLREHFAFRAGQHLTLRRSDPQTGAEQRRSYSICSTPADVDAHGFIRIGVREVSGGAFSSFVRQDLRRGDVLEVLPPLGHFTTEFDADRIRHYGAVAAGSGITPVLSLIATALAVEPKSRFTLLYGNRKAATAMFVDELADLKDRYPDRLHVLHVLSREPQLAELLSGRIDAARLRAILDVGLVELAAIDEWFLCGPYGMVMDVRGVLAERGVIDRAVHSELFHVEGEPAPLVRSTEQPVADATVTIILDGRESTFAMGGDERLLDAALRERSELPYACKGGVCSTCRARLVEGEVRMVTNYALEPDELAAGYVLTCQSVPVSSRLVVDYDA